MSRNLLFRGLLAASLIGFTACGDAEAPTSLQAEAPMNPDAVVIRAEESGNRVTISVVSENARPTALLVTITWDADKARLAGDFSVSDAGAAIIAADATTPGQLRIAAVGLDGDDGDRYVHSLGDFRLERIGGASRVELSIDVGQVLENEARIPPARIFAAPLSISMNR